MGIQRDTIMRKTIENHWSMGLNPYLWFDGLTIWHEFMFDEMMYVGYATDENNLVTSVWKHPPMNLTEEELGPV